MKTASLVLGILSFIGMFIGFIPCLGALNWINISFAGISLIISVIALVNMAPTEKKSYPIAGIILSSVAVIFGFIRLIVGGGVL